MYRNDKSRASPVSLTQSSSRAAVTLILCINSVRHEVTGRRQNRTCLVTCHDSNNRLRPSAESDCEPDYNQLSGGTVMFAQGSLKSHIALHALLPSFSNRSRTDSWSFSIVEDPLQHHEMLQSVTLRRLPAATLHGHIHGGSRTWRSSGAPSKDSAATLPAVILANRLRMTRCCAQNERVVFTNKLSITSLQPRAASPSSESSSRSTVAFPSKSNPRIPRNPSIRNAM